METDARPDEYFMKGRLKPNEYEDFDDMEESDDDNNNDNDDDDDEKNDGGGNGVRDERRRWPKDKRGQVTIPYFIDDSHYDEEQMDNIEEAMEEIESNTCINFVPHKREKDFIYFQSTKGKRQNLHNPTNLINKII
jgi:hypothetical protein